MTTTTTSVRSSESSRPVPHETFPDGASEPHGHRRSPWRQRLVDAERGWTSGFRTNSAFFVHLFGAVLVIAVSLVLDLTAAGYAVLALGMTLVMSLELMLQALLAAVSDAAPNEIRQRVMSLGTASVITAIIGTLVAAGIVFSAAIRIMMSQ